MYTKKLLETGNGGLTSGRSVMSSGLLTVRN
jgi:hypothetical protein